MDAKIPQPKTERWEKILAGDYIPLFGGRPLRSTHIGKDDVMDLLILLNTTHSVKEFLAKL